MAYTDRELLLLSNFVYIPACMSTEPIEDIIDSYRDDNGGFSAESVAAAAAGGGMSREDVATVFTEMDRQIKEKPEFGKLSASRTLEESDVRAVCYTGPKDNDPVVAFRGTGGTKSAWSDNFEGAFCSDTKIQRIADDFLSHECAIYDDITVTGHSKGGNLAQYVTVRGGERIRSCTSFDGQGFSEYFLAEYADEIAAAAPKIKSVSAYNDFVNILLTCIAAESVYVANGSSAAAAHSSVTLLCENEFDESGNIVSVRNQGILSKQLKAMTDKAVTALSGKGAESQAAFSDVCGLVASLALTTPPENMKEDAVAPVLGRIAAQFAKDLMKAESMVFGKETPVSQSVGINTDACHNGTSMITQESADIRRIASGVNRIREELARCMSIGIYVQKSLGDIAEDLTSLAQNLKIYADTADRAIGMYENAEREIALLMNA